MKEQGFYGFRERGTKSRFQSFALEIMAGCQLKCGNCYRNKNAKGGPMSSNFVARMIREAKETNFAEIVLIGGEPTLHPELPKFVEWTLKAGLTPILCTNGLKLAEKKYCQETIQPGTTVVVHGLVPVPPGVMDTHVGFEGYVERLKDTYQNLDSLRPKGITIVAEAVVIRPFIPYLLDFHKWCRNNGYIPFIEFNRRGNDGKVNSLSISPEEVYRLFKDLQNWDRKHFPELIDSILAPPAYGTKCTMSITGLHVKNFGDGDFGGVYSCCAQTVKHGDLRTKSLVEILEEPGMLVFKQQDDWIVGPCRDCIHYPVCRGGCRGEAALTFGCPRASCPGCWHISPEIRNDPEIMAPRGCSDCPLVDNPGCRLPR